MRLTLVCAQFYLVSAAKTAKDFVCQLIRSRDYLVLRDKKRPCKTDYEENQVAGMLMTTAPLLQNPSPRQCRIRV